MDFYKCRVSSFNILLKASFGIVIFSASCEIELFSVKLFLHFKYT
jgi:hypothetical protein